MPFRSDYLSRIQCDTIKGFFILLVFVSHFMQYVAQSGGRVLNLYIGQMMVAPFLFYSGYGVMESIKTKGLAYVREMPKRRMLTTLLNFDIAVIVFVVLNLILGQSMPIKKVLLSLVCWDSVGNSNWYIFVILLCYAIAYVSALFFKRQTGEAAFILCTVCMVSLSFVRPSYWYDTIHCFSQGMLWAQYKYLVEKVCKRFWVPIFALCVLVAFIGVYKCPRLYGFGYNIKTVAFAVSVVMFTMRFPVRNAPLTWCGQHLFPLYIYQRIPMIALHAIDPEGFANWRMPIYLVLSLVVTIFIAALYSKWQVRFL